MYFCIQKLQKYKNTKIHKNKNIKIQKYKNTTNTDLLHMDSDNNANEDPDGGNNAQD